MSSVGSSERSCELGDIFLRSASTVCPFADLVLGTLCDAYGISSDDCIIKSEVDWADNRAWEMVVPSGRESCTITISLGVSSRVTSVAASPKACIEQTTLETAKGIAQYIAIGTVGSLLTAAGLAVAAYYVIQSHLRKQRRGAAQSGETRSDAETVRSANVSLSSFVR